MNISIKITSKRPKKIHNVKAYEGRITIGDFSESIYVPLDLWSREDYERQWREGLKRLKTHNTSCLIATIHDPKIRPFIDRWTLYRKGNTVYVYNQMILDTGYEELIGDKPFTLTTCYDFIGPRRTHLEDGTKISEWSVPYEE